MNRLEESIRATVRRLFPSLDYLGLYPATVKAQNDDGSLELVPENSLVPAQSKVRIQHGVPGMKVKVAANARVLLGFEQGDPSRPFAALWGESSVTELEFNGQALKFSGSSITMLDGSTPVAKEGSSTTGHTHVITGTAGPYPISATIQTSTDTVASGAGSPNVKVP